MPPQIALGLCLAGMAWLLIRDIRNNPNVSHALWIPLTWICITGSRLPSEWLSGGVTSMASAEAYLEGSPVDRNVFLFLIVSGLVIVLSRKVSWQVLIAGNVVVAVFLLYTFVSIAWSDFPLTAFKRWHKVFGHVIMALVVYTEKDPDKAFRALFRRCGYILVPLSVVFIKYYPLLGRGFDIWTGVAFNVGVTTNKNTLGNQCLVLGLFFLMSLFAVSERQKMDKLINLVFLGTIGWLLSIAHSASSLAATVMGAVVIIGMKVPALKRHFTWLLVVTTLIAGGLQLSINLKDSVIEGLGRDTTLTGRTELWEELVKIHTNPVIGVGFESFWLGERVDGLWRKFWWKPNQAHNGYYEMYLNLGAIGVLLQLGMILSCYMKARRQMLIEPGTDDPARLAAAEVAPFRLAFALGLAAFNLTDATFKAIHMSFFVFFMVAIEYEVQRQQAVAAPAVKPLGSTAGKTPSFRMKTGDRRPQPSVSGVPSFRQTNHRRV